jgi:Protein of unknown function (DUF1475)
MKSRWPLLLLFGTIFLSLLTCTIWASLHQPVSAWTGLTAPPNHYWTIATMMDAYYGFVTFYVWVLFKEARFVPRITWLIAIVLLGNMAMSAYVILQLWRLGPNQNPALILTARQS